MNVRMPAKNETFGKEWADKDGESVFRKTFDVGPELLGKPLSLDLGTLDDNDEVYVNGVRVGGRGDTEAQLVRSQVVPDPADAVAGQGERHLPPDLGPLRRDGFTGKPETLRLHLPGSPRSRVRDFIIPLNRRRLRNGRRPVPLYN
jgi:hypothetical protein